MPVTERVMALGDWSLTLGHDTPQTILDQITTPFATIVITPTSGFAAVNLTDGIVLPAALYSGVVLRPGPQRELGGCSLAWFLGDETGGAGVKAAGFSWLTANTNSQAVGHVLSGTAFTVGTVSAGSWGPAAYSEAQLPTRRAVLDAIARNSGYEWRILPTRAVSVGAPVMLYGSAPTAVLVRSHGGRDVYAPYGIDGGISSTWDWETYGSKAYVYGQHGYGSSGGASPYRDPAGNLMTITRAFEQADAPVGSETTIAAWWLSQIDKTVRTVSGNSEEYAVTGVLPCGGNVYIYDPQQALHNVGNQIAFGGRTIFPLQARVLGLTWPVEKGMGVYYRTHNGSAATYVDLSDYVEWESPGVSFELSTSLQSLAPPSTGLPIQNYFSPWQIYAAEWRAVTTNPAVGNGTIVSRFRRLGTSLQIDGQITFGGSTTYGTGEWRVTLPPNCTATATPTIQHGKGVVGSGGVNVPVDVWVNASATEMRIIYMPTSITTASVTSAAPGGYAAGDYLTFDISLEIQP